MDIHEQLQASEKECERLRKENEQLRNALVEREKQLKLERARHRISIFKHLFKGRTDVFPVRWVASDGRTGYSPAKNAKHQYLALNDQAIYDHLAGDHTIGIYPIRTDNTCFFLSIDFDKGNWQTDALAFVDVCEIYNIPVSIEKSRSGNGCHLWIFFSEAISASIARQLGSYLLDRTRENAGRLDTYDRMFPTQDTLPEGGFGNLIALPLQREPRNRGNSVFTDKNFIPYEDQWAYLWSVQKVTLNYLDSIIGNSEGPRDTIDVKAVTIERKNGLFIEKFSVPYDILKECQKTASFKNPEYYKAKANRLSTKNIPSTIRCYDEADQRWVFPRGCFEAIVDIFYQNKIEMQIHDKRNAGSLIKATFTGTLTGEQEEALEELTRHSDGTLVAPTGFGKTVLAAAMIAKRKVNTLIIVDLNTLIIVDRTQLMDQWKERLYTFLDINENAIGQIGGGKHTATETVDIATYQSLNRTDSINDYGQIIVDECHHVAAVSYEDILKKTDATFVHGLTATPKRRDGHEPIMKMQCGPIRYKAKANTHHFDHVLIPKNTSFQPKNEKQLFKELSKNNHRNEMILNDVIEALERERSPVILTERLEHVTTLEEKFRGITKHLVVLTGALTKAEVKERIDSIRQIPSHEERLIIATGQYIGEGFDDVRLDTLFLAMPISGKGKLQQYIGRLQRANTNKVSIEVYDYVDSNVPRLQNMYEKRKKGYKALGFKTHEDRKDGEQLPLF